MISVFFTEEKKTTTTSFRILFFYCCTFSIHYYHCYRASQPNRKILLWKRIHLNTCNTKNVFVSWSPILFNKHVWRFSFFFFIFFFFSVVSTVGLLIFWFFSICTLLLMRIIILLLFCFVCFKMVEKCSNEQQQKNEQNIYIHILVLIEPQKNFIIRLCRLTAHSAMLRQFFFFTLYEYKPIKMRSNDVNLL